MNKVPNLRFNNFNDEWKEHVLSDIFEFYTTNSFSRDFLDNDNGSVKNIHYGDIHMKFPTLLDVKNTQIPYVKETVDLSKISIESYCKNGDVVIADASEDYNDIGKAIELQSIGEEKVIAGLHTILARDNKGIMVNGFRGYLMTSPNVRKQIKVYAAGAKVLGISKANISKVNLLIPSSMEQEKIASFFSLIDKKIELQTEKVEELTNYKKGIMQKIFSQELRFKDENRNEYPEWEEKKLGNFIVEYKEKTTVENQYPVLTSSRSGLMFQTDYFKDRQVTTEDNIGYHIIPRGYITFRSRSDDTTFKFNQNNLIDKGIISYFYPVFCFNESLNDMYALYFMNNYLGWQIRREIVGTSQLVLSLNKLQELKIPVPCIEEQNKIGKLLDNLENKILQEQNKLNHFNRYKKGLLQQMFI